MSTRPIHPRPTHPRIGIGALVWKGESVLLIRRAKPPAQGHWSLPGGSQELGETIFEAAMREVREETGITCRPLTILTAVDNIVRDDDGALAFHYTIIDVTAEWLAGDPVAGDDATDARWATPDEWPALISWHVLAEVLELGLREWRAIRSP